MLSKFLSRQLRFNQSFMRVIHSKTHQVPLILTLREPNPQDLIESLSLKTDESHVGSDLKTEQLSKDLQKALFDRIPPIDEQEKQEKFSVREKSLEPPTIEKTVLQQFPPKSDSSVPKVEVNELSVLRHFPDGKVPIAPQLNISFNLPMIAFGTLEQIEKQKVDIEIEPKVEGRFRWIGTKTVVFEPKSRFPQATKFTVKIPKGTKSQSGAELKEDYTFWFSTPPVTLKHSLPGKEYQVTQDPIFYLEFDQDINPQQVLEFVKISDYSGALKLISSDEVKKRLEACNLKKYNAPLYWSYFNALENSVEGRHFWFIATEKLKYGTNYTVEIGPKVPSKEGPLLSESKQSFTFKTFGPMQYYAVQRFWGYQPGNPWIINFTNPIHLEKFSEKLISVTPKVEICRISASHNCITINNYSKGDTKYTVTIDKSLTDIYGQTLGKNVEVVIKVGSAQPNLYPSLKNYEINTIDPTLEKPYITVWSINYPRLRVVLFQMKPEDFHKSPLGQHYIDEWNVDSFRYGKKVVDEIIETKSKPNEYIETRIDISKAFNSNLGHVLCFVEPEKTFWQSLQFWKRHPRIILWVQCTKLSIDVISAPDGLYTWVTDLQTGAPKKNVSLKYMEGRSGVEDVDFSTDENGVGYFRVKENYGTKNILIAKDGNDSAIISRVYPVRGRKNGFIHFVFDDRKLYKPKEEVNVKGFLRDFTIEKNGCYKIKLFDELNISYQLLDARYTEFGKGECKTKGYGAFSFKFTIPDTINLGQCTIQFNVEQVYSFSHHFQCQEFRTPEYNVSAQHTSFDTLIGSSSTMVTASAQYYSGGPLTGATASWHVSQSLAHYSPPGWHSFVFQKHVSKYLHWREESETFETISFDGITDSSGEHKLCIDFKESDRKEKVPVSIQAQCNIQDINRQTLSAKTSFIVHPSSLYVGVKLEKGYEKQNTPIKAEFIVTNIKGIPVSNVPIIIQVKQRIRKGYGVNEEIIVQEMKALSEMKPVTKEIKIAKGGLYFISATCTDKNGNQNYSVTSICIQGGDGLHAGGKFVSKGKLIIIPDKETYQPGDTAEIFVQCPFEPPCSGLLVIFCEDVIEKKVFEMKESSYILKVPIRKEYIPSLTLEVVVAGGSFPKDEKGNIQKNAPKKPAYATGSLKIPISRDIYKMDVSVTPEKTNVPPGSDISVKVQVKDSSGKPVEKTEVTLVAVDEAVLNLARFELPNPVEALFPDHNVQICDLSLRQTVFINELQSNDETPAAVEGTLQTIGYEAETLSEGRRTKSVKRARSPLMSWIVSQKRYEVLLPHETPQNPIIAVRSRFCPLAAFIESIETNKDGIAETKFKLPDNLTKYRIYAVAVHGDCLSGVGECYITANLPLMIRPSPPRFLNFGDTSEISVVLQNQSDTDLDVHLGIRMKNLVLLDQEKEALKILLPKSKRFELRFPVKTVSAGTALFQVGAAAINSVFADAATVKIPIWSPVTSEAFATYGELDQGCIEQPFLTPEKVFEQCGGLQVSTSSTALQALTDAFLFLWDYEFDCMEQISSRILSIIALQDVLEAFGAPDLPSKEKLKENVESGIKKLATGQRVNGSFGLFGLFFDENPFVSVFCGLCLIRAKKKGYTVPETAISRSLYYLKHVDSHMPSFIYPKIVRNSISAFALFVRTEMEDDKKEILKNAHSLFSSCGFDKISKEGLAILMTVFHQNAQNESDQKQVKKILHHLMNNVNETPETAHFVSSYENEKMSKMVMLHSNRRTDAIILYSLITVDPKNTLIPKIAKGLLKHRKKGRWSSTQECIFCLLALDKYFQTFEKETPDFVSRIWLGNEYLSEQTFKGRSTDKNLLQIPMKHIVKDTTKKTLLIQKEGKGRLYYRIGLNYAPKKLTLDPLDQGFTVQRTYEPISDNSHVQKDENGVWRIKAGQLVRVRITISNTSTRYHVALVDKLPAGLEALNPELKGTILPVNETGKQDYCWWTRPWFEHQNIRDERVEAFGSILWAGVHEYSYLARATSLGEYVVPPAKVEEMYSPELFGRSATEKVIVE